MTATDWPAHWRNEAKIAASDGHPHAALYAMAMALLPAELVPYPFLAAILFPAEWRELQQYADALEIRDVLDKAERWPQKWSG